MQAGVGFMTLDANQEKIATILLEYEDTKRQLALKISEAKRMSSLFASIAASLEQNPAYIKFAGESLPAPYSSEAPAEGNKLPAFGPEPVFKVEDFDGKKIKALTAEIRLLEIKLKALQSERENLGYPL
jgi:hypothetical protein